LPDQQSRGGEDEGGGEDASAFHDVEDIGGGDPEEGQGQVAPGEAWGEEGGEQSGIDGEVVIKAVGGGECGEADGEGEQAEGDFSSAAPEQVSQGGGG